MAGTASLQQSYTDEILTPRQLFNLTPTNSQKQ
jgi:hypothetical protein